MGACERMCDFESPICLRAKNLKTIKKNDNSKENEKVSEIEYTLRILKTKEIEEYYHGKKEKLVKV